MTEINTSDKLQFNQLLIDLTEACNEFKNNNIPDELLGLILETLTTYVVTFKYSFDEMELFNNVLNLLNSLLFISNIREDLMNEIISVSDKMEEAKDLVANNYRIMQEKNMQEDKMPIMSSVFALCGLFDEEDIDDEYKFL